MSRSGGGADGGLIGNSAGLSERSRRRTSRRRLSRFLEGARATSCGQNACRWRNGRNRCEWVAPRDCLSAAGRPKGPFTLFLTKGSSAQIPANHWRAYRAHGACCRRSSNLLHTLLTELSGPIPDFRSHVIEVCASPDEGDAPVMTITNVAAVCVSCHPSRPVKCPPIASDPAALRSWASVAHRLCCPDTSRQAPASPACPCNQQIAPR